MRNTLETIDTFGRVFTISNDGLIVCAVVWAAPETMPSARPRCTIIVPKYETSCTRSRAWSIVTPLWARSRAYSSLKRSSMAGSCGETMCASARSRPSSDARLRMLGSSPRIVSSATSRVSSVEAA